VQPVLKLLGEGDPGAPYAGDGAAGSGPGARVIKDVLQREVPLERRA
jgi:hypothetical protein